MTVAVLGAEATSGPVVGVDNQGRAGIRVDKIAGPPVNKGLDGLLVSHGFVQPITTYMDGGPGAETRHGRP